MNRIGLIVSFLWALPASLIGLVVALFMAPMKLERGAAKGALWIRVGRMIPSRAAAQTHGFVILARLESEHVTKELVAHELRHVRQYQWLGLFFYPAYGLASLWARLKHGNWYADNWFEKDATKHEALKG